MRKKIAPLLFLLGVLSIAAIACASTPPPTPAPRLQSPPVPPSAQVPAAPGSSQQPAQAAEGSSEGGTEFDVTLHDLGGGSAEYAFSPSEMSFKVGDTIEFVLKSESEFHTFTVDDLGIDTEVGAGETVTVSYTFDRAGEFALICIPHQFLGMTGTITVQ